MAGQNTNPAPVVESLPKDLQTCTITVRVIKNFEYRNSRNLILNVDTARITIGELKDICREHIASDAKFKIFRGIKFDTLKLYTQAFGNKSQNLIINLGKDGFLLDDRATLEFAGIRSETELSLFNMVAYDEYAKSPNNKW
ncbi:hypothetical protein IWW38_006532 [Coemansia aciculifera]|uniref:Uncharacterized protein n=1 Tax=Coemansia aciculifera TaxID=417176 RepID=A0ACC1LTH1_9FUNG|nr:hypothetical protein IWW38_006532 [Coemansia aciculifera]